MTHTVIPKFNCQQLNALTPVLVSQCFWHVNCKIDTVIRVDLRMYPPASKKKEVADALRCLMGPTEVQPGCVKCRLSTNDAVEHEEIWNSWELLEDHIRSDRFTRLLELMELSERQPHLVFHGFETRGMEYVEEVRKQKFGGKSRTKTFAQRWTRSSPAKA